jgi:hypothetical protein
MLSTTSERALLRLRAALAIGWLLLIGSLFWDPFSAALTQPGAPASPFRLDTGRAVLVQGEPVAQAPYAMGNRVFWTMLIPLIPLFLMVAGHEAWRRICPLSWWSQLPRRLGWQRRLARLNRRSGAVEHVLALPARQGWWRRNAWLLQFSLLFAALCARLLFINADRTALGVFLLGVLACALAVGWAWGGKTWCSAVCPVAVVQRIYTGPGGLLESRPHASTPTATPQSVCRRPGAPGDSDTNACVGCTPSCPDTDLEKSYWESVEDVRVRAVHYGFIGLVWGFYGYYRAYSGNWDYYFSGVWTHERSTWTALASPGFNAPALAWVPKWLAVPLFLGACVALAMLAGWLAERAALALARRWRPALAPSTVLHRGLVLSGWLAINSFYLFGGRPNLLLLPDAAVRLVDIVIVTLTTLWLVRSWGRERARYRKESTAVQLRRTLQAQPLQWQRLLDGRGPAELSAEEADVLARALPAQAQASQHTAFRQALAAAVQQHQMDSPETLRQLRELRGLLGIGDEEQTAMLAELGWTAAEGWNEAQSAIADNWLRLDNHRVACEAVVLPAWQAGRRLRDLMAEPELARRLGLLRQAFGVDDGQHARALALLAGPSGTLAEQAQLQLQRVTDISLCLWWIGRAQGPALSRAAASAAAALTDGLSAVRKTALHECLSRLIALDEDAHGRQVAADLASLVPPEQIAQTLQRLAQPGAAGPPASLLAALQGHGMPVENEPRSATAWARALARAVGQGDAARADLLARCVRDDPSLAPLAALLARELGWVTPAREALPSDSSPETVTP